MSLRSSNDIKAEAYDLGFYACGIAKAGPVDAATASRYREWVDCGSHGEMGYMQNNIDKRLDPRLLMPGVQSIVSVAMSYAPEQSLPQDNWQPV